MKIMSELFYYDLLTIVLKTSVNMTYKFSNNKKIFLPWAWNKIQGDFFFLEKVSTYGIRFGIKFKVIFFFRESFNLWHPLLMITLYHYIKTLINFWCRRELNFRSLIQP